MTQTILQGLIAIVNSIANEENDLAKLIGAEATKVNVFVNGNPGFNDVIALNKNVEQTLRTIVKKNLVLETKLQDALEALPSGTPDPALLAALGGVLTSIANEENALGDLINAEANKVIFVATKFPTNLNALTGVNNSVEKTLRTIIKKEIVLETKLQDVLDFIKNHSS
ncbi:hypothetical protein [Sporolactobacillus laevolacticus]|uniref:Uncharacterized protein n=1 Tax=Sporolactobacillus laevolacticus DSM 442 TaxID=1395513 RepID=V6IXB9_9BACL|nr:hypothetical protein [Sporolactobacillus laevolacticus]EST11935.1 hypothetical protein P343_09825 [Sporolactobacillus laevolacticus DSM 442]MDN3956970.1 hypothetical protein [Sporolactobacillus laevolacticus]